MAARNEIRSGALRGHALLETLRAVPHIERDAWVDRLFGFEAPPPDDPALPRGAVPYLPCGVDEVLAAVCELPIRRDDDFVDLGSGVGRVVFLVHLLSGARGLGIEIQAPLVGLAISRCNDLETAEVSFTCGDARAVELDGSVFFLYAPFNGPMLEAVLGRLERVAQRRPIRICAVGIELGHIPWLSTRRSSLPTLSFHESHPF